MNWQHSVKFTQIYLRSSSPTAAEQEQNRAESAPTPGVEIREVERPGHPLFRQLALFSSREWREGDLLGW